MVYYFEVRWLSNDKKLKQFYDFREDTADFMNTNGNIINQVRDDGIYEWKFLVHVTRHRSELDFKLQKHRRLMHELYGHVKVFPSKLRLREITSNEEVFTIFIL